MITISYSLSHSLINNLQEIEKLRASLALLPLAKKKRNSFAVSRKR